jgi:hypothetical protein
VTLRSVTHLVRRPDCLSGERDSISLRSANPGKKTCALPVRVISSLPSFSSLRRSRPCSCA